MAELKDILLSGDVTGINMGGTAAGDAVVKQSELITPANVITVATSGGDFTGIKDAMASILDNTSANRYTIKVAPGTYIVDNSTGPITIKNFVSIEAVGGRSVVFIPQVTSQDMFLGGVFTYLVGIVFSGNEGTSYVLKQESTGNMTVTNCVLRDCANGFYLNNADGSLELNELAINNPLGTTTVNAIKVVAGLSGLDGIVFRSTSKVTTGIHITGATTQASIHNVTVISPNVTTGMLFENGALVVGTTINIGYCGDGMVISGSDVDVKMDAMKILYCQGNGFRVENVGTNLKVSLFATTVSQNVHHNFEVLNPNTLVTGNGFTEINNSYIVPGAKFYVYLLDISEDDEGLNVFGEFKVGTPENPSESCFGEGDSNTRGMKVFTFDGVSTYVDVTEAASSASASPFTYSALVADAAIYIGSELDQDGDKYKHSGMKYKTSTAAVLGGGSIVAEYWNGSAWIEVNGMVTESSGLYHPSAKDYFQEIGSFQLRLDTALSRDTSGWTVTNPMSYTTSLYWVRYRITDTITTAPIFEQWKYHTNRLEANADGFIEYFGNGRPIGQLPINIGTSKPIAGNMQSETIWIDENIGVGYQTNKFTAQGDILGLSSRVPFNMDTSSNIYYIWSGLFSTNETPVFTIRWAWVEQGATLYTSNPVSIGGSGVTTVTRPVLQDINETFIAILDISELVPKRPINYGDELWITMQVSTLSGTFAITTATADYIKWSEGGHI